MVSPATAWFGEQRIGLGNNSPLEQCCNPLERALRVSKARLQQLDASQQPSPDAYTDRARTTAKIDCALLCLDAWADILLVVMWFVDGQVAWARQGFACLAINGCVHAAMFRKEVTWPWFRWLPLALAGLAPLGLLRKALEEDDPSLYAHGLKPYRLSELIFEQLPLLLLQMYVGLSYGQLDVSSNNFNAFLFFSTWSSLVQTAKSTADVETLFRPYIALTSWYGLYTLLCRTLFLIAMAATVIPNH